MGKNKLNETEKALLITSRAAGIISILFIVVAGILVSVIFSQRKNENEDQVASSEFQPVPDQTAAETSKEVVNYWSPPSETSIPSDNYGETIRYGKELIAHTSTYLGPRGTVANISNGMNCQNCHLDAGTKPFGNNYSAVYATYPKFRARSGTKESIEKRINDCFERSLNGKPLESSSKEMRAMIAYIKWLGTGVEKGKTPEGAGLQKLAFLDRAADPKMGSAVYKAKCISCHGKNGKGLLNPDNTSYTYPPLWGDHSYNDGAGLYRISSFAGFVKNNMPLGVSHENPQLTDEEAWDIAAFVNSRPRPHKDQRKDWKDLSKKPIDFPFGPYGDKFSEEQHKYGPFKPIVKKGS
ncbi:MAG: c-type cytochrome [Daejeonella sp.]|uniref:c-type cytochrome n=1 Tax=Daejeonella sp. TaxID=2805397 RepID=UPI00335A101F